MSISLCDLSAQNSEEKIKEQKNENYLKYSLFNKNSPQKYPVSVCSSNFYPSLIHRASSHSQTTTNLEETNSLLPLNNRLVL